jgi:hypothetical protein
MTERRRTGIDAPRTEPERGTPPLRDRGGGLRARLAAPRSRDEAEARYIAARDAWTAAMRQASSGRSADLAALALTQEAYEAAAAERERWASGEAVPIPIEPSEHHAEDLSKVVGQELAWRDVRRHEEEPRGLWRLFRRRRPD